MYTVEVMTRKDVEKGKQYPANLTHIRNISITGGRYLLSDAHNHLIMFRPDEVVKFAVWQERSDKE